MENQLKEIAKINQVSILVSENHEKLVPIRPICDALGIDFQSQLKKIKVDELLGSTVVLSPTVGADKKLREMACLPAVFVFGWLSTINPKNVKSEAKEAVIKYRIECYLVLAKHFTEKSDFLAEKQKAVEVQVDALEKVRDDFKNAKSRLDTEKKRMVEIRGLTFEEWQSNKRQLRILFDKND